jgi:hypothetical protein
MIAHLNVFNILFNVLVPVLIATAIASRGFRVGEDYVTRWAEWFNVALTHEARPAVARHLSLRRRFRTAGGLAGFLAPQIFFEVVTPGHQPDDIGGWSMTLMLAGYLLGALLAEIVSDPPMGRLEAPTAGAARLRNYLPDYALVCCSEDLGFPHSCSRGCTRWWNRTRACRGSPTSRKSPLSECPRRVSPRWSSLSSEELWLVPGRLSPRGTRRSTMPRGRPQFLSFLEEPSPCFSSSRDRSSPSRSWPSRANRGRPPGSP